MEVKTMRNIVIDGVEVTKCEFFDDENCKCSIYAGVELEPDEEFCYNHCDCHYKQLEQLKENVREQKNHEMHHIIIEFDIPDIVYKDYDGVLTDFEQSLVRLHGMTKDSLQVREYTVDEIPF